MTTKELLDEYAYCANMPNPITQRMQEIIKELEASIRKEVYVELVQDLQHDTYCKVKGEQFKECALCYVERKLSKGITLK